MIVSFIEQQLRLMPVQQLVIYCSSWRNPRTSSIVCLVMCLIVTVAGRDCDWYSEPISVSVTSPVDLWSESETGTDTPTYTGTTVYVACMTLPPTIYVSTYMIQKLNVHHTYSMAYTLRVTTHQGARRTYLCPSQHMRQRGTKFVKKDCSHAATSNSKSKYSQFFSIFTNNRWSMKNDK